MADFVETATLRLLDDSSTNINKINRNLRLLRGEAKKTQVALRRSLGSSSVNVSGINRLTGALNRAITASSKLNGTVIGPKSNTAQLNKMANAIERINKANSRASSRGMVSTVLNQSRPVGQRGGYAGGRAGNIFGLDISPLRIWQASFIYRLTAGIENAIINGFKQGTIETAITEARQKQLGYTPEQRAAIDVEAKNFRRQYPFFSLPQIRTTYSELGPNLGANPLKATPLIKYALDYQTALINVGTSAEKSSEGVRALFRSLDTINRIQDEKTGLISGQLKDYIEVITQETIRAGADIKPGMIATAAVYARTTGKTLTPEGFRDLLIMVESIGRVAGSSINRFVEAFSGTTTKRALAEQEAWGLTTTKLVKSGAVGGKGVGTLVRESTKDEQLLRENPNLWVVSYLIPELRRRGVDLSNTAQVAKELSGLVGTVVAKDVATTFATWQTELKTTRGASTNVQNVDQRRLTALNNPVNALVSTTQALQNAFGELGNAILANAITPLYGLSGAIDNFANWIRGDVSDPQNPENARARARATLGLGAVGAVAGLKYGWKVFDAFGLKGSAVALNTAAANLNVAATRLGVAGVAGAAGGAGAGALAAGAVAGGIGRKALRTGLRGGAALAAGSLTSDALRSFDPESNLWGLTSAIDEWTASLGYSTGRLRTFTQLLSSDAELDRQEAEQNLILAEEKRSLEIDKQLKDWQDKIKGMNLDSLRFAFPHQPLNDILWKDATTIPTPPELQSAMKFLKLVGGVTASDVAKTKIFSMENAYRNFETSGMSQFTNNIDGFPTSIDGLSETMKAMPTNVENSVRASGDGFGQAFLAYAAQFGAVAAAALNDGFVPPALTVDIVTPSSNTGTNINSTR